jgi:hypothetical protein
MAELADLIGAAAYGIAVVQDQFEQAARQDIIAV